MRSPSYVRDVMTREFPWLEPDDTLARAVRLLRQSKLDALPVVDAERRLVGYFPRCRLYDALLQGASLSDRVADYMVHQVITLEEDVSYETVLNIVRASPVGSAPVIDKEKRVVGLFTKLDGVRSLLQDSDRLNSELQAILNTMHSGLVTVDVNCCVTYVNASAAQVLGCEANELVGRNVFTFWPQLGVEIAAVMQYNSSKIGIKQTINGVSLLVNITPVRVHEMVKGATAVFQDLTEIERVAQELETVKELYETLFTILEIAYDGIVVVDRAGTIILGNRAFFDFIGLEKERVVGKHITEVMETSRLHIVAQTGVPEISDIQFIRNIPFIVTRMPIVKENQVVGAVGKIYFANRRENEELAHKLGSLQKKVEYYCGELHRVKGVEINFEKIITRSPLLETVKEEAKKLASSNSTILIRGESGTGKELFARAIHAASLRKDRPFVQVNCAAIPESLLESELFGYAPGAFTGASKKGKPGRFEMAQGGTLFLDEIGDMPLSLQAKILRAIETRQFERVGGTETIYVDVRIISATNKDLERAVREGAFREDLYYRLNVVELWLPPLRERKEDLELLVDYFVRRFNAMFGTQVVGVTEEAKKLLLSYSWPGNVRELENAIERGVLLAGTGFLGVEHLPRHITISRTQSVGSLSFESASDRGKGESYREQKAIRERDIILQALKKAEGNKTEAARILGISRSTLYEKMRRAGIS